MAEVEIFTPTGVLTGITAGVPFTNDGPQLAAPLPVASSTWYPIDGSDPVPRGDGTVVPDDVLLLASEPPELTVHLTWSAVRLEIGPYYVEGRLGTHPGYDPERAIARPAGSFVALRDARIELIGRPEGGAAERPYVHVNRYAVERVASTLMLGFYFPGALLADREPLPAA